MPFPIVPAIKTKPYNVIAVISDAVNDCLYDNDIVTGSCFNSKEEPENVKDTLYNNKLQPYANPNSLAVIENSQIPRIYSFISDTLIVT